MAGRAVALSKGFLHFMDCACGFDRYRWNLGCRVPKEFGDETAGASERPAICNRSFNVKAGHERRDVDVVSLFGVVVALFLSGEARLPVGLGRQASCLSIRQAGSLSAGQTGCLPSKITRSMCE